MVPSKELAGAPARRWEGLVLAAHLGVVALFCLWTMSLPVFPSQDGPIHLLYADVLRSLLFRGGSHFGTFFTVKHVLPPYSLYPYLLMGFGRLMPLAMADKVVVCLYMVSFGFGLRYAARGAGPSGGAMALLATPLLFNWALLTGLTSFLLSTTLVFWAAGAWSRFERGRVGLRVLFGVLLFGITLTHPVPLVLLGLFCLGELGLRVGMRGWDRGVGEDAAMLLGFIVAFVYVIHFRGDGAAGEVAKTPGLVRHSVDTVRFEVELASILPFRGGSALPLRLVWLLVLAGVVVLLARSLREWRGAGAEVSSSGLAWAAVCGMFVAALPFLPDDVGGGHNFAYRMMLYVWVSAFLGASLWSGRAGWMGMDRLRVVAVGVAVVLTGMTLVLAQRTIRPAAVAIGAAPDLPAEARGEAGLLLTVPRYREARVAARSRLSFDPFQWAGAGLFRRADAVLLDSPWLEEGVLPVGAGASLPAAQLRGSLVEDDRRLRVAMEETAGVRSTMLRGARFAVVVNGWDARPTAPDPLLRGWTCRQEQWYAFCVREVR